MKKIICINNGFLIKDGETFLISKGQNYTKIENGIAYSILNIIYCKGESFIILGEWGDGEDIGVSTDDFLSEFKLIPKKEYKKGERLEV